MGFNDYIIVIMINYFYLYIYIYNTLIYNFRAARRNEKKERRCEREEDTRIIITTAWHERTEEFNVFYV